MTDNESSPIIRLPDPIALRKELDGIGYVILRDVISKDFIRSQRLIWINHFKNCWQGHKFVRGNLIYGEPNFDSYSSIPSWCMHRSFEFLWNTETVSEHLAVHKRMHQYRNSVQDLPVNFGLDFNEGHNGVYISTSLYPSGSGHLIQHKDGHGVARIVHYMIPYTFKGTHYDEGGLYLEDRSGNIVDVDSRVNEGDVIFFDGLMNHGVQDIKSNIIGAPGRLASFAVPTCFEVNYKLALKKRASTIWLKEILNRLGLIRLY